MTLSELATRALASGQALKLPDSIRVPRVRVAASRSGHVSAEADETVHKIANSVWQEKGAGCFDGSLLGALEAHWSGGIATFGCTQIRYRDYLATDEILGAQPASSQPMAIGVHAVLKCEGKLVCLRLKRGQIGLPGGAVDAADARAGGENALAHALVRELEEETGIAVGRDAFRAQGIYVGGTPTHLIVLLSAPIDPRQVTEAMERKHLAADEDIVGIELISVSELIHTPRERSLALRLALQSHA